MASNFFTRQSNDFYGITIESTLNKAGEIYLKDKTYPWVYSNFGMAIVGQFVSNLTPNYRVLATVIGVKLMKQLQTEYDLENRLYLLFEKYNLFFVFNLNIF